MFCGESDETSMFNGSACSTPIGVSFSPLITEFSSSAATGPFLVRPTEDDGSSLFNDAEQGNLHKLKRYLDQGGDPNLRHPRMHHSMLHPVAGAGHDACLLLLLQYKADVTAVNRSGATALHAAARRGRVECVKILLDAGANPSTKNLDGETSIDAASSAAIADLIRGPVPVVPQPKTKLKRKLKKTDRRHTHPMTKADAESKLFPSASDSMAAFEATEKDDLHSLRLFLGSGGDANVRHPAGYSLLHRAAGAGHVKCLQLLLSSSADPSPRNNHGATPLHAASRRGHAECVKALLDAGAKISATMKDGQTPSDVACNLSLQLMIQNSTGSNKWVADGLPPVRVSRSPSPIANRTLMTKLAEVSGAA
mmetsp:Transcript_6010/g.13682  ORF Transcript_6010/g.13682 Transcript_6010/m.13682 type:complete len:367 (-) Transcript_6010:8-1108(-)